MKVSFLAFNLCLTDAIAFVAALVFAVSGTVILWHIFFKKSENS